MSDIPVHRVEQPIADAVRFHVGHYMTAVALRLLDEGLPVHGVGASGPVTDAVNVGDPQEFWDAGGSVHLSDSYTATIRPGCRLQWTAGSGWLLHPYLEAEPKDEDDRDYFFAGARWLADGLVPAPGRIAAFLLAAQLDWESAGSAVRPAYRRETDGYEQLLEALAAYLPDPAADLQHYRDWNLRFEDLRGFAYFWRTVDDLIADGEDPVVDVPLRRSEISALLRLLDLLQAHTAGITTDLAAALAADLTARMNGTGESAQTHRDAWHTAVRARTRRLNP
jgi:hypothetical protein